MKGRMISWMAILIALSVVGSSIKIPAVVGSVALDVFPAIIAAALFGKGPGAIVGAVGHLISAMLSGFPLGPMHLLIAAEMGILVWIFGALYKNNMKALASIIFIIGNAFIAPIPFIFIINKGFYLTIVPSLLIGSIINTVLALFAIPKLSYAVKHGVKKNEAK
jgi:uncharacterized membrane protein